MIDPADTVTLPLPQPTRLMFVSEDRVYNVMLQQDLLEDWTVVQSWGGKGNLRGGGKVTHVEDHASGMALLEQIAKRRERNGYLLATR